MSITILGLLAAIYYLIIGASTGLWISAFIVYFLFSCLGITITFHRYLTHNSFKFRWKWFHIMCVAFGSLAGTGSAIGWVAVHRTHHLHSDQPNDPHGPHKGWRNFFNDYDAGVKYYLVRDLLKDNFLRKLHNYGFYIVLVYYLILLSVGGLVALAFFGLIPQMLTIIISASCNYFAHLTGYQTYDTNDNSRNTWWLALPTWGDSWHNNHHATPGKYSFTHKWWEIDISGLIIKMIKG